MPTDVVSVIKLPKDGKKRCRHDIAEEVLRVAAAAEGPVTKTYLSGRADLNGSDAKDIIEKLVASGMLKETSDGLFSITKDGRTLVKELDAQA